MIGYKYILLNIIMKNNYTKFWNTTQIKTYYIIETIERFTEIGNKDGKIWARSTVNGYKDFLASLFK